MARASRSGRRGWRWKTCQKNLGCPLERALAWGGEDWDDSVLAFRRKCWEWLCWQGGHQKHITLWPDLTAVPSPAFSVSLRNYLGIPKLRNVFSFSIKHNLRAREMVLLVKTPPPGLTTQVPRSGKGRTNFHKSPSDFHTHSLGYKINTCV